MREDQTISVLLVEDEAAVRRSLAGKLRRDAARQYDIWEASHAEEAYEMIKRKQPHLILLDMRMPGMGGKQFLNILKEEFPSIKVIVLSGYSDFEFVQQALKCGASDYLLKPVINEELYEAVGRAVSEFISEKKRIHRGIQREMMLKLSLQMLKTSLLNSLLHKSYIRVEDVLGKLRYLNMEFRCRRYIAAVIRIADFAAIKEYYKSDASLIFFALENVMDESMTQIKSLFGFRNERVENEYVCIFGYDGDEAEMTAKLREDLARVLENVRKYNRMNLQIYLTGVFEQIADLHAAYRITSYAWKRKHADNAPGLFQFEQAARDAECDVPAEWTEAGCQSVGRQSAGRGRQQYCGAGEPIL
jgi:Response regulator containing CheY-like receiver domain and AraC-type DNA-binding domain